MGHKKEKIEKKEKRKEQNQFSFFASLRSGWLQKRPVLFFVFIFTALLAVFYGVWFSSYFAKNIQPHIVAGNARLSGLVLNLFRQGTQSSGNMIYSSAFSISVNRGCDATEAMALFASALLAFPAGWKKKIIGILAGIFILFILNLARIVSLFLTGVYYPKAFELLHREVWQVLFIFFAVGLWILWIQRATDAKPNVTY